MKRLRVSFVLPVLNAEKFLPACLQSIRKQDFPQEEYEILVADGGSTDRTRDIISEFSATLIEAPGLMAEAAKLLAMRRARGDYIALIDADNEVVQTNWLSRAIAALDAHPDALAFESYYFKHPEDGHVNRYLTGLLQISDPIARSLAGRLRRIQREGELEIFELPEDGSYPTGANGFIFKQDDIQQLGEDGEYHEASFFPGLMRSGRRKLIKIRGCGVYHRYVDGWHDYFVKRQRAMVIYMLRKEQIESTWDGAVVSPRKLAVVAYHSSFILPALEGIVRAIVSGDPEWLLHPIASAISTAGNLIGIRKYHREASSEKRVKLTMDLHKQTNAYSGKSDMGTTNE